MHVTQVGWPLSAASSPSPNRPPADTCAPGTGLATGDRWVLRMCFEARRSLWCPRVGACPGADMVPVSCVPAESITRFPRMSGWTKPSAPLRRLSLTVRLRAACATLSVPHSGCLCDPRVVLQAAFVEPVLPALAGTSSTILRPRLRLRCHPLKELPRLVRRQPLGTNCAPPGPACTSRVAMKPLA